MAFMQLVDQGLTHLDDSDIIQKLLPELAGKQILTGYEDDGHGGERPILVPIEEGRKITPRMLMNHTNGTGHTFFNPMMNRYLSSGWDKRNETADPHQTALDAPLMWQPGTHTNYGQGFEWLAVLIERLTGRSLDSVFQGSIFGKLGLQGTGWEESYGGTITSALGNEGVLWPRSLKMTNGEGEESWVVMDPPALATVERKEAYPKGRYHTFPLGTGLVSTASDLGRLLSILLHEGKDPVSGTQILTPSSAAQIMSPSLPPHLRNDSRLVPSAIPALCVPVDLSAEHVDPEGSFGLGCGVQGETRRLKDGRKGRGKGSVYWFGAANTEFWVDGDKGIAVLCEGNYFPWNDAKWTSFVAGVEGRVYEALA
ncbi:beta-lactamase/transpeptidase-like protein [Clohesyomyces aquaticus]|uniref:Beta-lactamase/transpeptidase-like protein n=1 Tax=Clohesyomyces aquaticus TaxID=1231657 RepID=A0A1Y1ZXU3_9PLEO|nr:beta-lactamase/transpeptidase-like protein [Clohesyomyces aquaticus]